MNSIILEYVVEIIATLIISVVGVLGTWALAKINKRNELTNIGIAMEQVISLTQITVKELQQTIVDTLKKDSTTGKLNDDDIKILKDSLLKMTLEKLSIPTISLLDSAKTDINALIVGEAEKTINEMKLWQ